MDWSVEDGTWRTGVLINCQISHLVSSLDVLQLKYVCLPCYSHDSKYHSYKFNSTNDFMYRLLHDSLHNIIHYPLNPFRFVCRFSLHRPCEIRWPCLSVVVVTLSCARASSLVTRVEMPSGRKCSNVKHWPCHSAGGSRLLTIEVVRVHAWINSVGFVVRKVAMGFFPRVPGFVGQNYSPAVSNSFTYYLEDGEWVH